MTTRVALVVSTTGDVADGLLAGRMRHLLRAGWDVRLLCRDPAREADPALADESLAGRVEFSSDPEFFAARLPELAPDLVHFHSGWPAYRAAAGGWRAGRMVVSFRDDGQDIALPEPALLWSAADLLVFPSAAARDRAHDRGWPVERTAVLIPPVIGVARPAPRSPDDGGLRLLSAGPVLWEHGLEHAVQAIRVLTEMGVDVEYRILGTGEHIAAVAFAGHQLGVSDRVHLLSPNGADGLAEELRAADVLIDAAVTDTTSPAPLLAALDAGVPFVATHRDPPPPDDAGILVPRRDPRALAGAVARLANDPGLRANLGEAGRRHAAERLARHAEELEALYRRVLGNVTE